MTEKTQKSSWVRCSVVQMALTDREGSERLWCPFASTCWHSGREL